MYGTIYLITRKFKVASKILHNIEEGIYIINETKDFGNDEFGKIINSLKTSIDKISDIFDDFTHVSINLEELSIKLKNMSKESKEIIDNQHKNNQNIIASVEESSISIGEISKIVADTHQESMESLKISDETSKNFNQTITSVNKIFDLFKNIENQIIDLNQNTKKIEEIINIIKEIAEQTNLIALNASIESAKSGSERNRFNVIAEEIRKLSLNTKESAEKISENIKTSIISIDRVFQGILDLNQDVNIKRKFCRI